MEESVVFDHFHAEDGWEMSEAKQRWFLRNLCKERDWYWPQVTRALRQSRTASIANRMGDVGQVEGTQSGILVFLDRFPEPQPFCPFKRKYFHLGFWADGAIEQVCESHSCKHCAPDLIEGLLRHIKKRIKPLEVVYVAQVPWDDKLTGRLAQRRHDHDMNTFTYRDVNNLVTIIGDKPLEGKRAKQVPVSSEKMTPDEVIEFMIEHVLWIPGYVSAHFSAGWAFPVAQAAVSGVTVSLDGLDDDQIEEFKRRAAAIVREIYDIEPGREQVPTSDWPELKLLLQEIKKEILGGD